jgi:hypothetical protein
MKAWDSKGLWLKSKQFVEKAHALGNDSPEFPFWASLALECLARAALTGIHPVLNADPREDTNILYALGFSIVGQPRSLPMHSVYLRLEKIVKGFGKKQRELCDFMAILRNEHLHSSELPYDNLKISKWLSRYYEVVKILNESLGKKLEDFLGDEIAAAAEKHVKTLNENILSSVKKKIAEHSGVFVSKELGERNKLATESVIATMMLSMGTKRQKCPACKSSGILDGERIRQLEPTYSEGELLVEEIYLAKAFKCLACGLSLNGLEEIIHGEIEPEFNETTSTSLHDLYEPEHLFEYDNM